MSDMLYKSKNAIIAYKPAGMPTQGDKSGDTDLMSVLSAKLKAEGEHSELYLIHRLDRVVGGLLVFALNKAAAAELSSLVQGDGLGKEYLAVVEGRAEGGEMCDYLRKDGIIGKAFVTESGHKDAKEARLTYSPLAYATVDGRECTLVKIKLITGRFHQIRAQFSHRGMPLVGDGKYGSRLRTVKMPSLFAYRIEANLFGERIFAGALPPLDTKPWNAFSKEIYPSD